MVQGSNSLLPPRIPQGTVMRKHGSMAVACVKKARRELNGVAVSNLIISANGIKDFRANTLSPASVIALFLALEIVFIPTASSIIQKNQAFICIFVIPPPWNESIARTNVPRERTNIRHYTRGGLCAKGEGGGDSTLRSGSRGGVCGFGGLRLWFSFHCVALWNGMSLVFCLVIARGVGSTIGHYRVGK